MYDLMFAENCSIEQLNPHNFALKNNYIDNLISTGMTLIPRLSNYGIGQVTVLKGFLSRAYVTQNIGCFKYDFMHKHTEGLAVELTWDNFDVSDATSTALGLAETIPEPVLLVVNTDKKSLAIYRDTLDQTVVNQIVSGQIRTVKEY